MAQTVNGGKIQFGVGFNVDQSGLNKIIQNFQKLKNIKGPDFSGSKKELKEFQNMLTDLQGMLTRSFNIDLGSINISKFNTELAQSKYSLQDMYTSFSKAGSQGQVAFNQMVSQVANSNLKLKQTKTLVDSLGQTFMNSIKWNIASSVINAFTGSIQQAFGYVKNLDSSLTNIRIVTGDSREQMAAFAVEANKAAAALGKTTRDYTDAALSFYQQGLNDEEVRVRTEASLKAQNITQGQASVDELTAVWNGYQVSIEETQKYVDKLAAVADSSASDMSQLATAMSKVAATANVMGVDIDQLTAQIATIVATTRQAPQTVGNALKTIYARINDIKAGTDEAEVSLGNYTGKMASLGINVLDANNQLRDTGQVMEEIGERWGTLTREQQVYLAQTMAGQRQYNQLISLFDNWTQYSEMLNVSLQSEGTLNEKNARYMESLAAHMEQFTAARQNLMDSILDSEAMKTFVDMGTDAVNLIAKLADILGGSKTVVLSLSGILTNLFSKTLGTQLNKVIVNYQNLRENQEKIAERAKFITDIGKMEGITDNATLDKMVKDWQSLSIYAKGMSAEEQNQAASMIAKSAAAKDELAIYTAEVQKTQDIAKNWSTAAKNRENLLNLSKSDPAYTQLSKTSQQVQIQANELLKISERLQRNSSNIISDKDLARIKQLKNSINSLSGGSVKTQFSLTNKWISQINKNNKSINDATQAINRERQALAELEAKGLTNIESINNARQQEKKKIQANIVELEKQIQKEEEAKRINTANLARSTGLYSQQALSQSKEVQFMLDQMGQKYEQLKAKADQYGTSVSKLIQQHKQQWEVQSVTKFTGALTQTVSAALALRNVFKTLTDKDTSLGDRISAGLMGAVTTLPMLITGLKSLRASIPGVQSAIYSFATSLSIVPPLEEGVVASTAQVQAALSGLMLHILPFVAIAGTVAAAAYGIYKWYNKDSDAAQKAAKAADQANEHYKELKDTLNDFNSAISSYDEAVDSLNKLSKGTEQWNEKLKETNEQVLQLLQKYPQLAGAISQNADGLLVIDKYSEAYKDYLEDLNKQTQNANVARLETQKNSDQAQRANLIRQTSRTSGIGLSNDTIDRIITAMQNNGNDILGNTQFLKENLHLNETQIKAIQDHITELTKLATTIENNTKATQILGTTISQDLLKNNTDYQNSKYQSEFANIISDKLSSGLAENDYRNIDRTALLNSYRQIFGDDSIKTNLLGGNIRVKNENGEYVQANQDYLKSQIAAKEALEDFDNIVNQTSELINKVSGKFEDLTAAALKFKDVKTEEDLEGLSFADISYEELLGLKLKEDDLRAIFNIGDDVDLQSFFKEQGQLLRENTRKYINRLPIGVQEAFKELNTDKMSDEMQRQVGTILSRVFTEGQGISGFEEDVAKALNDALGKGKLEELLSQNWDKINLDQATDIFKQLGIEVPKSQQALQAFINALKTSVQELTAQQIYNNIHNIIDKKSGKTLKQGDTITEQQYNQLAEAGVEVEGFFRRWIDGTYKLTSDAEKFYKAANSASLQPFFDEINRLRGEVEKGAAVNYNNLSGVAYGKREDGNIGIQQDKVQNQIDALKTIGAITEQQYANWNNLNDKHQITITNLQEINNLIEKNREDLQNYQDTASEKLHEEQLTVAYGAQDIGQLRDSRNREDHPFDTLSAEEYAQAVLYASQAEGIQIQNVKALVNLFSEQADQLDWVNNKLDEDKQAMHNVAAMMEDMVSGIQSIQKSWKQTIKEGVQPSAEVLTETSEALSDMFNQDVDASFVEDHLNEIRALAQGDIDAVTDIGIALANMQLDSLEVPAGIDRTQFEQDINNLQLELLNASDYLNDLEIGTSIDEAPFYDALQKMIVQSGMAEEDINNLLAGIGYEPQIEYKTVQLDDNKQSDNYNRYYYETEGLNGQVQRVYVDQEMGNAIASSGVTTIPIIKNSKFAGGSKNLRNIGGSRVTPKAPSGGGSGKKGGGGKGSGSTKKPKTEKTKEDKTDPYHMVNRALGDQQTKLKKIQQLEKDGLLKDKLKAIQDQNKNYEQQIKLLKEKQAIADAEQARLKNEITSGANAAGVQVKFTATGEIANYNGILDAALKKYNDYITNVYNNYSAEQQQAHAAEKQAMQKQYEQLKKNMEEYEKNLDLHDQLAQKLRQIKRAQTELYLSAMKYRMQAKQSASELLRDWQDFTDKVIKNMSDDDFMGQIMSRYSKIQSYINSKEVQERASQIKELQSELQRALAGQETEHTASEIQERLEELYKDQMKDLQNIRDLQNEIQEQFLDSLDNVKDKFDDVIDQYERINDVLEYGTDLTRKLYGDEAYEDLNKFSDQLYQNNLKTIQTLQAQRQWAIQQMNNSEVGSEAWKRAREMYEDIQDQLNDKILETLDSINDWWDDRVTQMADTLTKALSGGISDSIINADWDRISKVEDKFLDPVNRTYGIGEIEDLYQSGVDSLADSPALQQRLNKLMKEQLGILNEKDSLTQYDLDRAKALYDIEMKRYELEEARNNKTKLRLRRDSQGNYTYQYVADEEKLDDLQSALAKAQNDLYNNDKAEYEKNLNQMYDVYRDYLEERAELSEQQRQLEAQLAAAQTEEERQELAKRLDQARQNTEALDTWFETYYKGLADNNEWLKDRYLPQSISMNLDLDITKMTEEEKKNLTDTYVRLAGSFKQAFVDGIEAQGGIVDAVIKPVQESFNSLTVDYLNKVSDVLENATTVGEQLQNSKLLLGFDTAEAENAVSVFNDVKDVLEQINEYLQNIDWQNWIDQLQSLSNTLLAAYTQDDKQAKKNTQGQLNEITPEQATELAVEGQGEPTQVTIDGSSFSTDTSFGADLAQTFTNVAQAIQTDAAAAAAARGQNLASAFGGLFSGLGMLVNNGTIEQHVDITANFPNATDKDSIEQAILNVVNIASQKASVQGG